MAERKAWSPQQDIALKTLYESLRLNKWSHIAQQLEAQFGFSGRNGKQCRQRYNNHLDPALCKDSWTFQEELRLYKLHDELGNKWAVISQALGPGRTDNSVKNHYYSRLRKSLRRLNKFIHDHCRKKLREIPMKVLYKIIEASEERFKTEPMCDPVISEESISLKNKILMLTHEETGEAQDEEQIKQLIDEVTSFNRRYKRKPKKFRKVGNPAFDPNYDAGQRPIKSEEIIEELAAQVPQQCHSSGLFQSFMATAHSNSHMKEEEAEQDSDEIIHRPVNTVVQQQQEIHKLKIISPIILTSNGPRSDEKEEKEDREFKLEKQAFKEDKDKQNERILEDLGLLQAGLEEMPHPLLIKKQTSHLSLLSNDGHALSQSNHGDFGFFEDSEMQRLMAVPMLNMKKASLEENLFH